MEHRTVEWNAPAAGLWHLETTHLRGAQPRVLQEVALPGFRDGFRRSAAEYGLPIDHVEVQFVNDHCYGRMVPVGAPEPKPGKPTSAPPAAIIWLLARLHPELRRRARAARRAVAQRRWLADCERWEARQRPALVAECRELQAVEVDQLDDESLVTHLRQAADLFQRGITLHFDLMPAHDLPVGRLLVACRSWGIEPRDALALLAGSSPASRASTAGLLAIAEACATAGVVPETLDDVRGASDEAAAALDRHLADHGWRVVSQYSPRAAVLAELPDVLVRAIRAAPTARPVVPAHPEELRVRVPEAERDRFDDLLADARSCYFLRDDNVALTFMWPAGLVRRALLEAGRRLVSMSVLHDLDHVMALGRDEIAAALAGDRSLGTLAAERTAASLAAEADGPPAWLGDEEGPPPDPGLFPGAMADLVAAILVGLEIEGDFLLAPPTEVPFSGEGVGVGAGAGAHTGRACVAADAEDALGRLQSGEVLVTTHTTPAYEAVMAIAGAVVTESGGLMSHAAIVCREQGVPAVLGVAGATHQILDGDIVTVDPTDGRVVVVTPQPVH